MRLRAGRHVIEERPWALIGQRDEVYISLGNRYKDLIIPGLASLPKSGTTLENI